MKEIKLKKKSTLPNVSFGLLATGQAAEKMSQRDLNKYLSVELTTVVKETADKKKTGK